MCLWWSASQKNQGGVMVETWPVSTQISSSWSTAAVFVVPFWDSAGEGGQTFVDLRTISLNYLNNNFINQTFNLNSRVFANQFVHLVRFIQILGNRRPPKEWLPLKLQYSKTFNLNSKPALRVCEKQAPNLAMEWHTRDGNRMKRKWSSGQSSSLCHPNQWSQSRNCKMRTWEIEIFPLVCRRQWRECPCPTASEPQHSPASLANAKLSSRSTWCPENGQSSSRLCPSQQIRPHPQMNHPQTFPKRTCRRVWLSRWNPPIPIPAYPFVVCFSIHAITLVPFRLARLTLEKFRYTPGLY